MKHIYTIKGNEPSFITIEGKPCDCGQTRAKDITIDFYNMMGKVMPRDKGKRVYMGETQFSGLRYFKVENDEQYQKRTNTFIGCTKGHKPSDTDIDPCDIPF